MPANSCPSDSMLRQHLDNSDDESHEQSLVQHVQTCKRCQKRLGELIGNSEMLTTLLPLPMPNNVDGYRILYAIGDGGMGRVYAAEQNEPIHRKVALKMVLPGMASSTQVLARFERERRTLAMMDHPNIATVFDAGVTAEGNPYFVMELIDGVPITEFANQRGLSTDARIELMLPVLRAVQHAHNKGIIHRDLKPSNILVALADGRPIPKIIDFGLARAVKADSQTMKPQVQTVAHSFLGTLLYASPEQGDGLPDIDTRTDIYSLGVILYELLTGSTPLGPTIASGKGMDAILQELKNTDPPRPSQRIAAELKASPSSERSIQFRGMMRSLRSELDWVIMKALEKHRSRRYETAAAFADDLARYLNDVPVVARPPSIAYSFRRFVSRHRIGVSVACTIATLLFASIFVAWALYAQAMHNLSVARKSRDVSLRLIKDTIYAVQDELETTPKSMTARRRIADTIDKGLHSLEQNGLSSPELQQLSAVCKIDLARILAQSAQTSTVESTKQVEHYLDEAIIQMESIAEEQPDNAEFLRNSSWAHNERGLVHENLSQFDQAVNQYQRGLIQIRQAAKRNSRYKRDVMWSLMHLADVKVQTFDTSTDKKASRQLLQDALAGYLEAEGLGDEGGKENEREALGATLDRMCDVYMRLQQFDNSHKCALKLNSLRQTILSDHENSVTARDNLALARFKLGTALAGLERYEQALVEFLESLRIRVEINRDYEGSEPNYDVLFNTADSHLKVSEVQAKLGHIAVSIQAASDAMALFEKLATTFPNQSRFVQQFYASSHHLGMLLESDLQISRLLDVLKHAQQVLEDCDKATGNKTSLQLIEELRKKSMNLEDKASNTKD